MLFSANAGAQSTQTTPSQPSAPSGSAGGVQEVYVKALGSGGYDKTQISVKKGIPVNFHFSADANTGCGRALIIDDFNVKLTSMNGEDQVAHFTPQQEGTFAYHCGMNMYRGQMTVTP